MKKQETTSETTARLILHERKSHNPPKEEAAQRPLYAIAHEIQSDWKKVTYEAKPYLAAMATLNSINDTYIYDTAKSIVNYFLSNAGSWRGEVAKRVKAELKKMAKY